MLKSKDLIALFNSLLNCILKPTLKPKSEQGEKEAKVNEETKLIRKSVIETLIQHTQSFLKWLIDLGLKPDLAKLQTQPG